MQWRQVIAINARRPPFGDSQGDIELDNKTPDPLLCASSAPVIHVAAMDSAPDRELESPCSWDAPQVIWTKRSIYLRAIGDHLISTGLGLSNGLGSGDCLCFRLCLGFRQSLCLCLGNSCDLWCHGLDLLLLAGSDLLVLLRSLA